MKNWIILFLLVFSFGLWPVIAQAETSTKSSHGVKAVLKTDPTKKMIDLFLSEATSTKEITEAKVTASVRLPDGKKVKKELIGMKMGDAYSFMNSLDMSRPGRYSFDIEIKTPGKTTRFEFTQHIR